MNTHPEFIQPIQDVYGRLIRGDRGEVFVDYVRQDPESIQFIDEILRLYPYNQPPYHFIDIPQEEFVNNEDLTTVLMEDSVGTTEWFLNEQWIPLRTDIDSAWEVDNLHPWTKEEGQQRDLTMTVNVFVSSGGVIKAKIVDIHC